MIEDIFNDIISKFNEKAKTDEKLRSELAGISKRVVIRLDDGRNFNFDLTDGRASELRKGSTDNPDIEIESDEKTIEALYKKDMRTMKALALKKVRIKGSIEDLLRLRKFF
jgi:putative sterol carrier protein